MFTCAEISLSTIHQFLAISALKGALRATGAEDVTYVNAPGLAAARNLTSTSDS
jgi:D-3-phosphoglycerate dehydrogenase / 2-oxoglutarate reductase